MANLARTYKAQKRLIKAASGKGKEKESLSKHGHELLEVSGAVGLMVLDKNIGTITDKLPVNPSAAAGIVGLGMMVAGRGKTRKLGRTIVKSSIISTAARYVWGEKPLSVLSDNTIGKKEEEKKEGPKVVINLSPDMIREVLRTDQAREVEAEVIDTKAA